MDNAKLTSLIGKLLMERFPDATIKNVVVRHDFDSDGDKILRIVVILTSDPEKLDKLKLLGFVPTLRPKLEAAMSEGFPVMSFVSERDAGPLNLEAA